MRLGHRTAIRPYKVYKRQQAGISRRRLYPVTAFYGCYLVTMLVLAWRTNHRYIGIAFLLAGIPVWTLVEYLMHRYVFHHHFTQSGESFKKFYTGLGKKYLDALHWEHHERAFDGYHINGELQDLLPLFSLAVPLSFIFPVYTAPMLLAGVVQSYVVEEWIHHCIHYYNFRDPYFRHVKRYHLYHHTSAGIEQGFGITNGFWDIVFKSRFPDSVRRRLFPSIKQTSAKISSTRSVPR
jgi:dihydroceramide fatty acyl 2-hydroxylase